MAERFLRRVEDTLGTLAGLALAAMVLLMGAEVVARYLLGSPLSWAVGLISNYLMVGFFFLGLPVTVREGAHVAIDVLYDRLPGSLRPWCDRLAAAAGLVFVLAVAVGGVLLTADVAGGGYAPPAGSAELSWPVWTSTVLVPIGALVTAARLVLQLVGAARAGAPAADPTGNEVR
ncbi:TRAP transporter small permease [Pseudonocardia nantongensis]|uniref:TRAP transporter small permease n=1 Tax=Pseudonocardia nantongensis TaxID=1181885 RepID=UPI003978E7E0